MWSNEENVPAQPITEQDFIAASCAVVFAGASVPTGDMRTRFKNLSPGYCSFTVLAEIRLPGWSQWLPVDTSKNYPYNGEVEWSLQTQQDFEGNIDLPSRMRGMASDYNTPGAVIDALDGAWLRISIVERQRAVSGMKHVYHHPQKFFHFSSGHMGWIPEPADLG